MFRNSYLLHRTLWTHDFFSCFRCLCSSQKNILRYCFTIIWLFQKVHTNGSCAHEEILESDCIHGSDTSNAASNFNEQECATDEKKSAGAGVLIIMFYYFQDALLLHVETGNNSLESVQLPHEKCPAKTVLMKPHMLSKHPASYSSVVSFRYYFGRPG